MNQILRQFNIGQLSIAERLELIGQIWDSLDMGEGPVPVPDGHWRELERRLAGADADPGASIPWETVKARLADRP